MKQSVWLRAAQAVILTAVMLIASSHVAVAGSLVSQLATDKAYSLEVIAHATCPSGTFDNSNRRAVAVQADFSKIATIRTSTR
jgi:hypothetical protein